MTKLYNYIKVLFMPKCKHEFYIEDFVLTGIKPPKKPMKDDGYFAWRDYFQLRPIHDSCTKRIKCECFMCGEMQYAHCGLMLKGRLRSKIKKVELENEI